MYTLRDKLPASVEADKDPERLSEIERQKLKTKWLEQERKDREEFKAKQGENDE